MTDEVVKQFRAMAAARLRIDAVNLWKKLCDLEHVIVVSIWPVRDDKEKVEALLKAFLVPVKLQEYLYNANLFFLLSQWAPHSRDYLHHIVADRELVGLIPPIISSAMAAINHTSNIGSWVDQYLAPISRKSWADEFSEKEPRVWDKAQHRSVVPAGTCR